MWSVTPFLVFPPAQLLFMTVVHLDSARCFNASCFLIPTFVRTLYCVLTKTKL